MAALLARADRARALLEAIAAGTIISAAIANSGWDRVDRNGSIAPGKGAEIRQLQFRP